jgi:hypothetical protein
MKINNIAKNTKNQQFCQRSLTAFPAVIMAQQPYHTFITVIETLILPVKQGESHRCAILDCLLR